ncbi:MULTISPECIES: DUF3558 family protein [unclassified Pseudonocardia]|uniref:DUF3558 family protein n=1 Tax=unclassified Pseudonocardia TaxID=2619320 RepID=UPI001CF6738C|nr:DUF3558 family protein [Pseudonocardia sp. ICBG162]
MVRLVVVLLLVCGVVVGCRAAEPEGPFPARPAEIDVANVDPCVAMTPELRQQWGVEGDEPSTVTLADGPSRVCGWGNNDTVESYSVQTIQTPAAKVATAQGATITVVDGFGAVRMVESEDTAPLCELYLDAAETAGIRVQVRDVGYNEQTRGSIDDTCRRAEVLARSYLIAARSR